MLVSVVTPCLDLVELVGDAVRSMVKQDYNNFEHIVVDGGSQDGTLDVLRGFDHLRVVSGPDNGVYDALNKGLMLARGEIIGNLNADDLYEPGILADVVQAFRNDPEIEAVMGGGTVFSGGGETAQYTLRTFEPIPQEQLLTRVIASAGYFNAWFFRRRLFDRIGLYDTSYRTAGDLEFLLRVSFRSVKYELLDRTVYHYRQHPTSLTFGDLGDTVFRIGEEALRICEIGLRNNTVSAHVRRQCRAAHRSQALDLVCIALKRKSLRMGLRFCVRGWKKDPLWPHYLARNVARRLRQM